MIYFNGDIKNIQYSGHTISKVYSCGGNLVWSGGTTPPTPPTGNKLTYTISGNTYYIPCDNSSTLTKSEILNSVYDNVGSLAKLDSAIIGECVTVVGDNCFNEETNITSVTIPNTVTTINHDAFHNCNSLSSITIPSSVTSIGTHAFDGCSGLTSIDIPSGITEIPICCFDNCISLSAITIPSGVTSIESGACHFDYYGEEPMKSQSIWLAANRSVTINAVTPPTVGVNAFDWTGQASLCTYPIYVQPQSVEAYKTAWPQYANRLQAIP